MIQSQGNISRSVRAGWKILPTQGDCNGDGKSEIRLRSDSTGTLWQYQLNGTIIAPTSSVTSVVPKWGVVG